MSTDEIVCKVAEAIGVNIKSDIEISHRLNRRHGIKPIIAKFSNHKDKTKVYKALKKKKDEKILSAWSLDGKIFQVKTSPTGRLRRMSSIEEVEDL